MEGPSTRSTRRLIDHLIPTLVTGAFLLFRASFAPRGLDDVGPAALRDAGMSLAFWLLTVLLGMGVGEAVLNRLHVPGLRRLEIRLYSFGLGLGAISLAITALGLTGLMTRIWVSVVLVCAAWIAGPRIVGMLRGARPDLRSIAVRWREAPPLARIAGVLAAVIGLLAVAQALTPPWDYDGLMYHLVGPRMFLEARRIFPYPDNWYVNGPFSVEMLFSIGMSFGDDVLPKLIHLGYGFVLVGATYSAARRWIPEDRAWLAPAILLTVPTLPIFSAFAYIDLGWSSYEFLALLAVVLWWESRSDRLLLLAGLMIGWAMGSKYLGLEGCALLGMLIMIVSLRDGVPAMVRRGLIFGVPALGVALPWYLKNAVWFGNPVFPLYFGGPGWDATRLGLYSAYLDSFGVGRTFLDYLLLPVNIYIRHVSFGAVMNRIDMPSLLFPLIIAYPLTKRIGAMSILLVIALGRFVLWAAGSQQIRFLFPIYPVLALGAAHVINRIRSNAEGGRLIQMGLQSLTVGLLVIPLFYQSLSLLQSSAIGTMVGATSKRAFLEANVAGFRAFESPVVKETQGRTLLLGDGRDYYCSPECTSDPDHFRWAAALGRLETCASVRDWMDSVDSRAIMFNLQDIDFLLQHDPAGVLTSAVQQIQQLRADGCLQKIYEDGSIRVFALAE